MQSGPASFDVPVEQATVIGRAVLRRLGIDRPDDPDDAALAAIDDAALLVASRDVEREMFGLLDTKSLYRKLGVSAREDAVAQARVLGLL